MGQLGSQDGGTSSAGTAPGVPGMVRPSDLMGIEDYKDLRFNTTVKGGVAGIFSGVGTSESGQCSPRRHGSDALV
jgi:hypothetical protein